jgi:hypothetical protein
MRNASLLYGAANDAIRLNSTSDFGILKWALPSFWRSQDFLLFIYDE